MALLCASMAVLRRLLNADEFELPLIMVARQSDESRPRRVAESTCCYRRPD